MAKRSEHLTQSEVGDLLREEGLDMGIATGSGTISAFVQIPMYSTVCFRIENNKFGGFYPKAEVLRFISDYRMAKKGQPGYEGR